ncbi:N-6 DNA methylase [Companilactobacillus furfuricola]|uniref:N-6 DNA methylase n=1 Tax=Companilactobacillus furfuricola TaxID=1462575 RepID=UPI000F78CAB6|nr:N-6 DNA methylase [Companilactobacillus furfuricola]
MTDKYVCFWEKIASNRTDAESSLIGRYALKFIFFKYIKENNCEDKLNLEEKNLYDFFTDPIESKFQEVKDFPYNQIDFKSLSIIANMVLSLDFNNNDLSILYDICIRKISEAIGKRGGNFLTPKEICQIMSQLAISGGINKSQVKISDSVMGSGQLLTTLKMDLSANADSEIDYYGEELNLEFYDYARMRLIINGIPESNLHIHQGDTLTDDPNPKTKYDYILENPPYSVHWDDSNSELANVIKEEYGVVPPKTKGDFAFIIQGLNKLADDGTMVISLPHGILFRHSREETLRKELVKRNLIDAIISLPTGLYDTSAIATMIMVLKKDRDKQDILFIDASEGYKKIGHKNVIQQGDIKKIVNTYDKFETVPKYSYAASAEEIEENDYNLNISRYVDTYEEPKEIDIEQAKKDIDALNKQISINQTKLSKLLSKVENEGK